MSGVHAGGAGGGIGVGRSEIDQHLCTTLCPSLCSPPQGQSVDGGWQEEQRASLVSVIAAAIAQVFATVGISPFDIAATRIYNQPTGADGRGLLYSGPACVRVLAVLNRVLGAHARVRPMARAIGGAR